MGILTFVFATILFLAGFVYPDVYKALEMPNSEIHVEFERKEAEYEGEKILEDSTDKPENPEPMPAPETEAEA